MAPSIFNQNSRGNSWKDCDHSSHHRDNDRGSHSGTGSAGDAGEGGLPLSRASNHPPNSNLFFQRV
jgi:hypothetical protein